MLVYKWNLRLSESESSESESFYVCHFWGYEQINFARWGWNILWVEERSSEGVQCIEPQSTRTQPRGINQPD